jgi:hypothetical protein
MNIRVRAAGTQLPSSYGEFMKKILPRQDFPGTIR